MKFLWRRSTPLGKVMIFFQSQVSDRQPGRQRFCHIADVPGFVRHAGDLFFIFRIPENKAIERSITLQPSPFSGGSEFFAQFHMEGRTGNIKGQSALVLACTWSSYKSAPCKKLLLSLKRAVAGDCPQIQAGLMAGMEELGSRLCSLVFQKTFRISRCSLKRQPISIRCSGTKASGSGCSLLISRV